MYCTRVSRSQWRTDGATLNIIITGAVIRERARARRHNIA